MLRNYLMPGFALVMLAFFAAPRSTPPVAPETASTERRPAAAQEPATNSKAASSNVPQIGTGKLLNPDDVCSVAKWEMQEKLGEFGLNYAAQTGDKTAAGGPAAEAIIALIPDPVHTHLALLFDRNVDVIQQALQDRTSEDSAGWIYTNQWLPWDPVPYQASQDAVERTNNHAFDADRECAPGFLLFRRNRFQAREVGDKFLVVFLVGESPTSGILRQDQFINAMRGWRALERREKNNDQPAGTLRVLGPTFSASLSTLDTLLLAQNCKNPTADRSACFEGAQVVSGSVSTSRKLILQSKNFPGLSAANFISMDESARAVRDILVDYLGRAQHISPEEIAFVSEDETPFGNLLSSTAHPETSGGPTRESSSSAGGENSPPNPNRRPMQFHYPREISQLRNAYEKNSIFSRQVGQSNQSQTQQDLTLSLEDRHEEEDSVPPFSSSQNPVSEESVLSEMMRAMDRERIRIAVINGTDVLDVIFVARYLSHSLPDLRVVLLNNDLLFERSPDVSIFRGMLAVNSYPLIPDNIQWTGRFSSMPGYQPDHASPFGSILPDRLFSSFETTGVYNAVRLLELAPFGNAPIDAKAAAATAEDPIYFRSPKPLWLAEYSDPFRGGSHPPLWLTAVGRGGFWPVALLDPRGEDENALPFDACADDAPTDAPSPSGGPALHSSLVDICAGNSGRFNDDEIIPPRMFDSWWTAPFTIAGIPIRRPEATQLLPARLAAVCLLALFILFGLIFCLFARLDRWPQYLFDIPGTNAERRAWIVLVIILTYSWIARLLILDLPGWRFFNDPLNCGLLFLELVLLLFAIWLIRTAFTKAAQQKTTHQRSTGWQKRRVRSATVLIILTFIAQLLFHWVKPGDFAASLFYLYRSQHLFSGVCPVLPFIFLCIAVICLVSRHIQSLLAFSPLHKPRIPSYGGKGSPPLLQFITSENVRDILLACYSPWRMLWSKLENLLPSQLRKYWAKRHGSAKARRLRRKQTQQPAASLPALPAILLFSTLVLLLLSAYLLFPRGFETFETRSYSILLSICTFALVLVMLHEIVWVILMWVCLHRGLLRPLERSTLRACFSRVSGFSWRRLWFSIDQSPAVRYKPLSRAHESMRRMYLDRYCPLEVSRWIRYAGRKYARLTAVPDSDCYQERVSRVRGFYKFQWALCRCATEVIARIISETSRHKEPLATSLDVTAKDIEDVLTKSAEADSLEANAEEFVGLLYIYAIQHVLLDIRSHILAFTFSYFFLLMALNGYAVVPHHSIMVLLIGLLLAFVIVVVAVFAQMHRDTILSRTTSTEPGKLDLGFYEKLISVLGVPIIGLLASQFPEISNFLFSWLEPSLQTLK